VEWYEKWKQCLIHVQDIFYINTGNLCLHQCDEVGRLVFGFLKVFWVVWVAEQWESPIDFTKWETTFFFTSINLFLNSGSNRLASCCTSLVLTWMPSCRVLKTKRDKLSLTPFKMLLPPG
jgi:hypothetical protein